MRISDWSSDVCSSDLLASATLGTFHERRGEQALLRGGGGALPATWGRVFAENSEIKWDGDVAPSLDGALSGFQIGQDFAGFGAEIGRASCRARVCQYVSISVVAVSLNKHPHHHTPTPDTPPSTHNPPP